MDTDELNHVVYTRSADGSARMYVDNVEVAGRTIGGNLSTWDDDYGFALANEFTLDRAWRGEIHLVAIYNRALTPADIQLNLRAGPGFLPKP